MPIYEFQCGQCGRVFEELVKVGSTGEGLSCPACGCAHIEKKMSACNSKVTASAAGCPMADSGACGMADMGGGGCCGGMCAGH